MDPRRPTPTILPSQGGYSPPAADSAALPPPPPAQAPPPPPLQTQNLEYGGVSSSHDLASAYDEGGKQQLPQATTASSSSSSALHNRQPLQESTGNAQYQQQQQQHHYPQGQYSLPSLPSTRSGTPLHHSHSHHHHQFGGPLAPPPAPVPTPPAILHSHHDAAPPYPHQHENAAGRGVYARRVPSPLQLERAARRAAGAAAQLRRHPFYGTMEFRQYREKQKEKDQQKWTPDLEEYYLDGCILCPFIGRRKIQISGKGHGRNMIISYYMWLRWLRTQPNPETIKRCKDETLKDDDKNQVFHPMYRKRKQVSSHSQVLKEFFKNSPVYHFFFCKGEEPSSKDKGKNKVPVPTRWYNNNADQCTATENPVLSALARGQLPSVRPNYEYFGELLALNKTVQIRPATSWIYVANRHLVDRPSAIIGPDSRSLPMKEENMVNSKKVGGGSGVKLEEHNNKKAHPGYLASPNTILNTFYSVDGSKERLLYDNEYPHRYAFNNPPAAAAAANEPPADSAWAKREQLARNIRQTLLHEYTFDLKQTDSSCAREVLDEWAAEHTELHDMLQGVIEQHDLLNAHALGPDQQCDIIHVDVTLDVHRVHCLPKGTSFEWPFKISVDQPRLQGHDWSVLTHLDRPVELVRHKSGGKVKDGMVMTKTEDSMTNELTHARDCSDNNPQCVCRSRHRGPTWYVPIPVNTWAESLAICAEYPRYFDPKDHVSSRSKKEEEARESETVTQMDLMKATAMFQELWSSAPAPLGSREPRTWTRRAVICWTFNTIHFLDREKNLCETPAQTTWRFLSAVDPLSATHQDKMFLPALPDDDRGVTSPTASLQHMLNTQMNESLGSVWNLPPGGVHSAPASMPVSPYPPPLHVTGNFAHGLVTPPASATLPSTYTFEGLPNMMPSHTLPNQHMGYLPVTGIDSKASFATGDGFNADAYLQGTNYNSFYQDGDDNASDTTLQGDSADLSGFDTQQWSNLNNNAHASNDGLPIDWNNGLHSLSMVAEEMAGNRTPKPDNVQHLPPYADLYAQLHGESRDERYSREEQKLRSNHERRDRREARREAPIEGEHNDSWNTNGSPSSGEHAIDSQSFGQNSSVHLSQSSNGAWADDISHISHSQLLQNVGLTLPEPSGLQEYGSASLGPLLNRKRRRDDDDDDHSHDYPLPSYAPRDGKRHAPDADRDENHSWP